MKNLVLKISLLMLIGIGISAHAVPNTWGYGYSFGQAEFFIENNKQQSLNISCGEDYGRDIFFHDVQSSLELTLSDNLSFLFDDKIPISVGHTRNNRKWNEFNKAISRAQKIEVFHDNHLVATFKPLTYSVKNQAKYITDECADNNFSL